MGKSLYIAEKPSVAQEFAKALHMNGKKQDGYLESEDSIITWCVGHLVTMSYPEVYDPALKKWSMETIPFLPSEWKYEVISSVKKQYEIVKRLLNRSDVDTIYVCTDSGREGEYIYRLVEQMAQVKGKKRLRVWIDSQTEEEIQRGIAQAKDLSEYDNLSASAYLRAKEDYLMGINFSRALTLKFGPTISNITKEKWTVLSIGRVMTCVLGMVVRREREIRTFVKTPFYRVIANIALEDHCFDAEWRAVKGSRYFGTPVLYKENGFKKRETAQELIQWLEKNPPLVMTVVKKEKKKEKKNPPLLFNLAELQNECSKRFKISPDTTLQITQELYEKKLVTYPRTDARVLSSAVAKEIGRNIAGLRNFLPVQEYAVEVLEQSNYKAIAKTRYVNDKQITDHYAIIPTGQGMGVLKSLSSTALGVYERIVRRFLSIFYPPAVYQKYNLELEREQEHFFASFRQLESEGYLKVANEFQSVKKPESKEGISEQPEKELKNDPKMITLLNQLKKGDIVSINHFEVREGETSPPKRYNSGSMILAMENAGQLIEDEELRAQIKGSGIGTSATRAEILKKLVNIRYLTLNGKTQIITPTLLGELVFDVVDVSMRQMLNPELTASWEKGLSYVAGGSITSEEYMQKLEQFVINRINGVKQITNPWAIRPRFEQVLPFYKESKPSTKSRKK
ncbi:DNA topoisomerase 3 [Clostridiales bacterium CHKCI001]|nr:DNA topoisomerase 3 [Clostridiales bacterium CHKCI001]